MFEFFKKKTTEELIAPVTGELIDISKVPDKVFSQKLLGDGIAIKPIDGLIVAPCKGKVVQIFPTKHAIGIRTKLGFELLIHIGLDTVVLKGKGFEVFINEGDKVKPGDKLMKVDIDFLKENVPSIITPIVITNGDIVDTIEKFNGKVECGKDIAMRVHMKKD